MRNLLFVLTCVSGGIGISFSQSSTDYFKEKNVAIGNHFLTSDKLQDEVIGERFDEMTRSDGYVVEEVSKQGSVMTRKLHRSGKVIFNSDAGDYLNELKSKLLEDYPEVDKLITVFITEDEALNAFATVNNNIYVNMGLLARVETEAQLAFILSHEIMHVVNEHIINQSLVINRSQDTYDKGSIAIEDDFKLLHIHALSRSNEVEADTDGLYLFLKQDYDPIEGLEALVLLKSANGFTIDIPLTQEILFINDSTEYDSLLINYRNGLKVKKKIVLSIDKQDSEEENELLRTHPQIDDRIQIIQAMLQDVDSSKMNGVKYVVSESKFKGIHEQANAEINRIFSEDLDFVSLFLNSSSRLHHYGDSSDQNLNYLGYAIQGLLIDHIKKFDLGKARSTNPTDSVFSFMYDDLEHSEFASWAFRAIDGLYSKYPNGKLKSYHMAITRTIVNEEYVNAKNIFGDKYASVDQTVSKYVNGLDINDLNFQVRPYADFTRKMIKDFNQTVKYDNIREGKVAVINMNNVRVKRERAPSLGYVRNYVIDETKSDLVGLRADKVWENLAEDYPDKIVSVVPNQANYSGENYALYDKLNQWMSERLYFNDYFYVSIHQDDVNDIIKNEEILYAFSSLNIEIKSFSMKNFLVTYFSPFVTPHYVPQLVGNIVTGSTRKYQLSLIYSIETGALTFWDTRTYTDPNTASQMYMVYDDVFSNYFNKEEK